MSMNCAACEAVKQNAPSVIANGMGDAECASLANDTGLTPSVGHNDCTDLNDLNDCLIGNMDEEIETQEICDWKPFTKRLIANLWTVEKAIICAVCGLWTNVHSLGGSIARLCTSIDNILGLIRGGVPRGHYGYFTNEFKSRVQIDLAPAGGPYTPSIDKLKPSFNADILNGMGCESGRKLGRWNVSFGYDDNIAPYFPTLAITSEIPIGTVIGVIPRSAVPESDMPLAVWKQVLMTSKTWQWFNTADSYICVQTLGYVVVDGIEFNRDLAPYGENNMVITAGPYIGASKTGGLNALNIPVMSYDT